MRNRQAANRASEIGSTEQPANAQRPQRWSKFAKMYHEVISKRMITTSSLACTGVVHAIEAVMDFCEIPSAADVDAHLAAPHGIRKSLSHAERRKHPAKDVIGRDVAGQA
jgi:hypothetical protein